MEVLLESLQVEALELLRIIEGLLHRAEEWGVLVEELKIQLIGPPFGVRSSSGGH
jgi:hypothetical protein